VVNYEPAPVHTCGRARGQGTKERVWQTILEWLAVISGLVALLHFFFPKHGARAGDYFLNRFAELSKVRTEKRIKRLQAHLFEVDSLPLLTDFEEKVLIGFSVLIKLILAVPMLLLAFYAVLRGIQKTSLDPLTSFFIVCAVGMLFALAERWRVYFDKFRYYRASRYRDALRKDIEKLQARLNKFIL